MIRNVLEREQTRAINIKSNKCFRQCKIEKSGWLAVCWTIFLFLNGTKESEKKRQSAQTDKSENLERNK